MIIISITADQGVVYGLGEDDKLYIWSSAIGDWELKK